MKDIVKRMREDYNQKVSHAMFQKSLIGGLKRSAKTRLLSTEEFREVKKNYEISLQNIRDLDQEITEVAKLINQFNG